MSGAFEVLELDASASLDDVRKAYKRLALKYHPDKNPGDPTAHDAFQRITTAYTTICCQHEDGGDEHQHAPEVFNMNFGDIFSQMFRQHGGVGVGEEEPPVRVTIALSLHDLRYGGRRQCEFRVLDRCAQCAGTGARDPAHDVLTCPTCAGKGVITACIASTFVAQMPCPGCNGVGHAVQRACARCKGARVEAAVRTLNIQFPHGLENGHESRLHGCGNHHARSSSNGDVCVVFTWRLPPECTRVDLATGDVHWRSGLDFRDLLCGFERRISVYDESSSEGVHVKCDTYVDPDVPYRVRGGGIPQPAGSQQRGDLVVSWSIEFPSELPPQTTRYQDVLRKIFKRNEKISADDGKS